MRVFFNFLPLIFWYKYKLLIASLLKHRDAPLYLEWAPANVLSLSSTSEGNENSDVVGQHDAKRVILEQHLERVPDVDPDPDSVEVGMTYLFFFFFSFLCIWFNRIPSFDYAVFHLYIIWMHVKQEAQPSVLFSLHKAVVFHFSFLLLFFFFYLLLSFFQYSACVPHPLCFLGWVCVCVHQLICPCVPGCWLF